MPRDRTLFRKESHSIRFRLLNSGRRWRVDRRPPVDRIGSTWTTQADLQIPVVDEVRLQRVSDLLSPLR